MTQQSDDLKKQIKDKDSVKIYAQNVSKWHIIERGILILTFISVAIGTLYSVLTARRALVQSSFDLRPWISTPKVETYFKSNHLETRFEITNIGKIPAYVFVDANVYRNSNPVPVEQIQNNPVSLMPSQKYY